MEVRSHMEGTIPATELDSGAQLQSQGRDFQSVREDTQRERRGGSGTADTSDTDSLLSGLPPVVPRRRLRLTWNPSHSGHTSPIRRSVVQCVGGENWISSPGG